MQGCDCRTPASPESTRQPENGRSIGQQVMCDTMKRVATVLGLLLAVMGCRGGYAQSDGKLFYPPPQGLVEAPAMVLSQYLMRRAEIARVRPILVFCDGTERAVLTPAFAEYLTRPRTTVDTLQASVVESVKARTTCGTEASAYLELRRYDRARDVVLIRSMRFNRDSSVIDAMVRPGQSTVPPFATIRTERFLWKHAWTVGGQSLVFSNFHSRN